MDKSVELYSESSLANSNPAEGQNFFTISSYFYDIVEIISEKVFFVRETVNFHINCSKFSPAARFNLYDFCNRILSAKDII